MTADDRLAAEYVLGLLDAEDTLAVRGRLAREPEFAGLVARWEEHAAPLLLELGEAEPPADMLDRILASGNEPMGETVRLRRSVTLWRWTSAAAASAALVLAVTTLNPPAQTPAAPVAAGAPLVASVPVGETLRLGVTYLPHSDEMLVSASGLQGDGVHDHELWLQLPDNSVRSLGVVVPGKERRVRLEPALAAAMQDGAQVHLSREALGGARAGAAPGPVVASATLKKI